jgi:dihydroorotate dehydrogenase (fumarate)
MNLSTTYMGLKLPHPLVSGASPLVDDFDLVKRLEDAGAAAIVMHSLFEEQITREEWGTIHSMEVHAESFAEAISYFPEPEEYNLGPEQYLEQIRRIKSIVRVPVIGSLNGTTAAGWLEYAKLIQQAGADALELNLYFLATEVHEDAASMEKRLLETVRIVRNGITIPVAVKLSPYFTTLANFVSELDQLGVDGIVLFNRFYQPDIDPVELDVVPALRLSDSSELLLRLRWLAILYGRIRASLAVSGGIHTPVDVVKAIMTGASAVQVVSALLRNGPEYLSVLKQGLTEWLEENEYESVHQIHGNMSLQRCSNTAAFERANYMRVLQSWRTS